MTQIALNRRLFYLPVAVAGSHLALELIQTVLPVVYPLLISQRGFTYAQIGSLALVAGLAGTLTQPLFGWLTDRTDARWLVFISISAIGAAMALVGFATDYRWLILLIALTGLASAAYHPAGALLATAVSRQRQGTAMSLFSTGGALGAAFGPLLVGLILSLQGLTGMWLLLPLGLALAVGCHLFLRHIPITSKQQTSDTQTAQHGSLILLVTIVALCGTRSWMHGGLSTFLPEWYARQGMSLESAGMIFAAFQLAVSAGGLGCGFIVDRVGPLRVTFLSFLLITPAYALFLQGVGTFPLIWLMLLGVCIGATFPTTIVLAQQAWPRSIGFASALVMGIGWLPASLGAWYVGRLAEQTSLMAGLQALTYVPFIGLVLAVVIIYPQRR